MLQSYEAIYDHGQMKWIGDCPQVDKAHVIVTVLADALPTVPAGQRVPSSRIAGKGKVLGDIVSPVASVDDWSCLK